MLACWTFITGKDAKMTMQDKRPKGGNAQAEETPEAYNAEQDDEGAQAQTVAEDARDRSAFFEGGDSRHGGRTNPAQITADDEQDVVDHMQQMERSGRIDMGAYRGERNDDDESEMLGEEGMEPEDLDEHGNPPRNNADPYIPEDE